MADKREVGNNSTLNVGGEKDVPITNVSYTLDAETSESQFNDDFHKSIVFTGTSYSGSFEHDGSNRDLQLEVRDREGKPVDPETLNITVKESERTITFSNCIVTSRSKDVPSDDRTSETYDFVAENVWIIDN